MLFPNIADHISSEILPYKNITHQFCLIFYSYHISAQYTFELKADHQIIFPPYSIVKIKIVMTSLKGRLAAGPLDEKCSGLLSPLIGGVLTAIFFCVKMSIYLWSYPLSWAMDLFNYALRTGKVLLTFFVGGLQGVFRSLGVGVFGQKIHYAVLKENGQYLKLANKTLEDIFTCQLYDYSIRKFLSIPNLDEDLRVTEIQVWSNTGLNYLTQYLGLRTVTGIHNSTDKLNKFQTKTKAEGIFYQSVNYSEDIEMAKQDIFIFFNRGKEKNPSYENYVDIIKILAFIKKNMSWNGYAVVGNYFTAEGEIKVFEELIDAFGFKIEMEEDITRNIMHSRKVLNKIHKNRKLAWLMGRGKEAIYQYLSQCGILNRSWEFLQKAAGLKQDLSQYKIYILEHHQ